MRREMAGDATPTPTLGHAEPGPQQNDWSRPVLWVPDPEQWHGWREVYIERVAAKPGRPMGFAKPGDR